MVAAILPAAAAVGHCLCLPSPSSSSPPLTSDDDDGDGGGGGGGDDGWRNSFSSSFSEFCNGPFLYFAQFLITKFITCGRLSIAHFIMQQSCRFRFTGLFNLTANSLVTDWHCFSFNEPFLRESFLDYQLQINYLFFSNDY